MFGGGKGGYLNFSWQNSNYIQSGHLNIHTGNLLNLIGWILNMDHNKFKPISIYGNSHLLPPNWILLIDSKILHLLTPPPQTESW